MKRKMVSCMHRLLILTSAVNFVICGASSNFGYFWQVTDFHYDANYSVTGTPSDMCHQGNSSANIGNYGNYLCDSPWQLITAAVEAMYNIQPDPDFILWTGDSVPHVKDSDLDPQKVYTLVGNVTKELMTVFPNISIFPVLGNHDPYPANQMPYDVEHLQYYKDILNKSRWDILLGHNESSQFLNGGYYSSKVSEKLRVIGLNTNLYYSQDKLTKGLIDPANQFDWLEKQLTEAKHKQEAVYIVAHVPPGVFELVEGMSWFYPDYNKKLLNILVKYSDVIKAQMYGHEHTDSFRILLDDESKAVGSLFLCPAVTPWKSTLAGVGANNPSIRLYQYDRENGTPQKYLQYYLNLTAANVLDSATKWQLEYDTSDIYSLDDLKPEKIHNLVKAFHNKENHLFRHYLDFNSVRWDTKTDCNETCFERHYCAITELDMDKYKTCIRGGKTTPHPESTTHHHHHTTPFPPVPNYIYYVIGGLAGVVFLLFLVITFMCFNNKHRRLTLPRYAKFGSLSVNS